MYHFIEGIVVMAIPLCFPNGREGSCTLRPWAGTRDNIVQEQYIAPQKAAPPGLMPGTESPVVASTAASTAGSC